jgi:hypothetical protein
MLLKMIVLFREMIRSRFSLDTRCTLGQKRFPDARGQSVKIRGIPACFHGKIIPGIATEKHIFYLA